ncbi:hypothetical protein AWRI1631_150710 [Saccharomyces cerevisiae AWRI1631]|uniref:Uncharacterized protein n=1 Tax=Saccharomyces cerevisiae (strain AWRI1631) TaxID=545124 RepID=B5VRG8_YEAS6|nr:hypothetical protein AWRI1631_150710 [Saccharomyces cerevisiae AWRI1631]
MDRVELILKVDFLFFIFYYFFFDSLLYPVSKVNELVKSFFFKLKIFFLKSLSFWTSYDMNSLKSELITILPKLYLSSELISILFTT